MGLTPQGQSLHGHHLVTVCLGGKNEAGVHRSPIEEDSACPTVPGAAALFHSFVSLSPQKLKERFTRIDL